MDTIIEEAEKARLERWSVLLRSVPGRLNGLKSWEQTAPRYRKKKQSQNHEPYTGINRFKTDKPTYISSNNSFFTNS